MHIYETCSETKLWLTTPTGVSCVSQHSIQGCVTPLLATRCLETPNPTMPNTAVGVRSALKHSVLACTTPVLGLQCFETSNLGMHNTASASKHSILGCVTPHGVSKHQIQGYITPFKAWPSVTKHSINDCVTLPGDNVRMRNTQIECFATPKVVAAGFPPDLGFRNTRFLQCATVLKIGEESAKYK